MAYKQYFAKDRQFNSKSQELSLLFIPHGLDEINLSGIFPLNCINLSQAAVELRSYIHKLTTERWTYGLTDKHDVYRTITFKRSCNVLKVNPSEIKKQQRWCQTYTKTEDHIERKLFFNSRHLHHLFSAQRKCNICAFHED